MPWQTLLVLGGIGSGHTGYAEALLAGTGDAAPGWTGSPAAGVHRIGTRSGGDLAALAGMLAGGEPDRVLLVDDLTGWLGGDLASEPDRLAELVTAVQGSASRLVLVSAEVGLQTTPSTAAARRSAEAIGRLNRAVASAVDAVVLVVAGQPSWLKGGPAGGTSSTVSRPTGAATVTGPPAQAADQAALELELGTMPRPDDAARTAAGAALAQLGPVSFGGMAELIRFAAGCQATPTPRAWRQVRVVALGTADSPAGHRLREGHGPLAQLAAEAGAQVRLVDTAAAGPLADGPAMPDAAVEPALRYGWSIAGLSADEGTDLLVLASLDDDIEAAAAAVTTMLVPGSEPAGLLGWVRSDQGTIDDRAWIARCAAARDAVRRARAAGRGTGRAVLAELGGPLLATATGLLLGAAARRTPVLLDGPAGAAAGLVARNLAAAARDWWLLPDTGGHPLVSQAAGPLGQQPLLDLRLRLGEGATSLATLPLLRGALSLAAGLAPQAGSDAA